MSAVVRRPSSRPRAEREASTWFLLVLGGHRRRVPGAHRHRRGRHLLGRHDPRGDHRHLPDPDGGIGGLWAERAGVVNIGLEGQMILGTWGAALLHLLLRPVGGRARRGAVRRHRRPAARGRHGDVRRRPHRLRRRDQPHRRRRREVPRRGDLHRPGGRRPASAHRPRRRPPTITVPGISDASLDLAEQALVPRLRRRRVRRRAHHAACRRSASWCSPWSAISAWVLWRTPFGLRLRSCGENPQAAETLGVNVYLYKYIAVIVSGGLAGIGGGFLALVASSGFNTGQTGGRGYIGLAAMIFGNWRPGGLLAGALMFGYTDALRLRNADAVHALLLLLAIGLLAFAAWRAVRKARGARRRHRRGRRPAAGLVPRHRRRCRATSRHDAVRHHPAGARARRPTAAHARAPTAGRIGGGSAG